MVTDIRSSQYPWMDVHMTLDLLERQRNEEENRERERERREIIDATMDNVLEDDFEVWVCCMVFTCCGLCSRKREEHPRSDSDSEKTKSSGGEMVVLIFLLPFLLYLGIKVIEFLWSILFQGQYLVVQIFGVLGVLGMCFAMFLDFLEEKKKKDG